MAWADFKGGYESFLGSMSTGVAVVYRLDPSLASQLQNIIQKGGEFVGLAQQLAGGSDAQKGAAIQAVVRIVIAAYTQALERMAMRSKTDRDRMLAEARREFFEGIISKRKRWPAYVGTVPHIGVQIAGGGVWTQGGQYHPAIYKPERKSATAFRYLRPGPTKNPVDCAATTDQFGSVEGTDSSDCVGQIGVYPLLYPCWRERSLSTGGEFVQSSDVDNPGAQMLDLQTRALFEPAGALAVPFPAFEEVVKGFEARFWAAVHKRKTARRDPTGQVGPKPDGGWSARTLGTRAGGNDTRRAGLCGVLTSPGATENEQWANGLQVLKKKPADPNFDERFWLDGDGIIRAVWSEADLELCGVLSWGTKWSYDPDTGDRGICTVSARNSIWAMYQNLRTAREFWGSRDYVRKAWKRGDFDVDPSALPLLKPKRIPKGKPARVPKGSTGGSGGGGGAVAVAALAAAFFFK